MSIRCVLPLFCSLLLQGIFLRTAPAQEFDLVVYGGTSGGVIAAVQAARMGKSVVLVCPDKHLGGLSSGGLGWTDSGNKAAIGGLSRDFYHRIWKHYQEESAWRWQKQAEFGNRAQSPPSKDGDGATMWTFEPRVAEKVFEDLIREHRIPVHRNEWLDRAKGVQKQESRIAAITTLAGNTYRGRMFIDATYEGDLLAAAGISYHVGREANSVYGETWNGVQVGVLHHSHYFKMKIDPYVVPGDRNSGLLPRISADPPGVKGEADHRVQAYCFRMCLSSHPENRVPFPKPDGYDPAQYELLARVFAAGWRETFNKFDPVPNHKTDTNNHGPFSTDNIGFNYDYPNASYERRREIIDEHRHYQQGLMYFLQNDPRVPEEVRTRMQDWGLPKDEFTDNGGWPHQLYIREARRMVGEYVMTEHDCLDRKETPESVGMGSYTVDSHNVQRYITPEGYVQNEGDIGVHTPRPYRISYGSLTPKKSECENLLVPVCCSSSHIAYGSIRMEPVFMILGQSAATAAVMSLDAKSAVQDLPYEKLRERLLADNQVLELEHHSPRSVPVSKLKGTVVDDRNARLAGEWQTSATNSLFVDNGYQHDGNAKKGELSATFSTELAPGRYEVRVTYPPNNNRASNVPVEIRHRNGVARATINQKQKPKIDDLSVSLGEFDFDRSAAVTLSNAGTDGYVIIDAVQFVPVP